MIGPSIMDEISNYYPEIKHFILPGNLLAETVAALRTEGGDTVESIVFWAGRVERGEAAVTHLIIPTGDGVFRHPFQVRVDESVIAALCDLLDPPQLVLLGQVHTHLGAAFHSPSDDRFSFDTPGYLSVVVPRCGRSGAAAWLTWGFHECLGSGRFRRLRSAEITRRFRVEPG